MGGQYSLDGKTFDFHGLLKLDAKLSQMTTGWKSILLKSVDPFFEKHGAGTELPFKVSGTREAPRFRARLPSQRRTSQNEDPSPRRTAGGGAVGIAKANPEPNLYSIRVLFGADADIVFEKNPVHDTPLIAGITQGGK